MILNDIILVVFVSFMNFLMNNWIVVILISGKVNFFFEVVFWLRIVGMFVFLFDFILLRFDVLYVVFYIFFKRVIVLEYVKLSNRKSIDDY